ncbi:hypothetical protein Ga0100230_014285 [Opitutaceae bacterium TAV3]|nr:hypothetical protein Ga0100230_014285 [Opitutaceae bacterium TAV3]
MTVSLMLAIAMSQSTPVAASDSGNPILLRNGDAVLRIEPDGTIRDHKRGHEILLTEVRLWEASFENGEKITDSKAGQIRVTQTEQNRAQITLTGDKIDVKMDVLLGENHLEVTPRQITNKTDSILSQFTSIRSAWLPLGKDMIGVVPTWGGLAFSSAFLASGASGGGSCPRATHDLVFLESPSKAVGVYSVQPMSHVPFNPTQFGILGNRAKAENLTGLKHGMQTWIQPGSSAELPPTRIVFGRTAFDLFAAYRRDNDIDSWPDLLEKIPAGQRNILPNALHFKLGFGQHGRFVKGIETINTLPDGTYLVEIISYWARGGVFDVDYPDFARIAPSLGGEDGFRQLIKTIKDRGSLASAYTNPTWFQPDSNGTHELGGMEAIAVRNKKGDVVTENYGKRSGFAVGIWRPQVQKYVQNTLTTLRGFGLDYIFQDQYGTRRHDDFSKDFDAPPYAWNQALIDLAAKSSQCAPIMGEGVGFDRTFRHMVGTMGYYLNTMSKSRAKFYNGPRARGLVQQWPLGTMMLHDKIAFYPHNLSGSTFTSENVSWALAFGMNLHYRSEELSKDRQAGRGTDVVKALAHIQEKVCSQYFGQKAVEFRYLDPGMSRTRTAFANGLVILGNHEKTSHEIETEAGIVTLAPHGFVTLHKGKFLCGLLDDKISATGIIADWDAAGSKWNTFINWTPSDVVYDKGW